MSELLSTNPFADNSILNLANEQSALSGLVNWQRVSKNDTVTPINHPTADKLPLIDPIALEGGTGSIDVEQLMLDRMVISAKTYSKIVKVSEDTVADIKENPDGIKLDDSVGNRFGALYANTADGVIKAAVDAATPASIENTDFNDLALDVSKAMANLEAQDMEAKVVVLPRRSLQYVRDARTTDGRYIFREATDGAPASIHGVRVLVVPNQLFAANELALVVDSDWVFGGMRQTQEVRALPELYAAENNFAFRCKTRLGVTVLKDASDNAPAVKIVNDTPNA